MTDHEKNCAIEQARGCVSCDAWGHAFHGFMAKGTCGHEKCYPAQCPVAYTEYLGAIIDAENELVTDEDKWLSMLSAKVGKSVIKALRYATAAQRTDVLLEYLELWKPTNTKE